MAKDTTYRPGVYRERGGDRLVAAATGEIKIDAGGRFTLATGSKRTEPFRSATNGLTLTRRQSGVTVISHVANLNHTLPNATGSKGLGYTFVLGTGALAATGGAGLKIHPVTGDKIYGGGLSATGNKNLALAGSTDALGDFAELKSDGTSWIITGIRGGWTVTTATA